MGLRSTEVVGWCSALPGYPRRELPWELQLVHEMRALRRLGQQEGPEGICLEEFALLVLSLHDIKYTVQQISTGDLFITAGVVL